MGNNGKTIKLYIIFTAILVVIFIIGLITSDGQSRDFSTLIPTSSVPIELFLLFVVFTPLLAIFSVLWSGWVFGPAFLGIHIRLNQKNCEYGIVEMPKDQKLKPLQGMAPIFLAMNLAFQLCTREDIIALVLGVDPNLGSVSDYYMSAFVILLTFFVAIGFLIFTPIWYLIDAGIVYSNTKKQDDEGPIEVKTVGSWFLLFLKGYIGISTVYTYYAFVVQLIMGSGSFEPLQLILVSFLTFGLPLIFTIESIPAIILLNAWKTSRNRYMLNIAHKWGIAQKVKISFIQSPD